MFLFYYRDKWLAAFNNAVFLVTSEEKSNHHKNLLTFNSSWYSKRFPQFVKHQPFGEKEQMVVVFSLLTCIIFLLFSGSFHIFSTVIYTTMLYLLLVNFLELVANCDWLVWCATWFILLLFFNKNPKYGLIIEDYLKIV